MRIFKFWTRIERPISIGGEPQTVHAYGGSNISVQAAAADAEQRLDAVRRRAAGEPVRDEETYEVDIREEVLARIDERNVVTRNRYGAAVLNSAEVLFIDIDEPRLGFMDLFRSKPTGERKTARIVDQVKQLAMASPALRGLGVRLYATHKGVRAIVTGRAFDPRAAETAKLLRQFNADGLYSCLCRKQGCFRARLTPKPFRMKCRTRKVVFPRADAEQEAEHRAWVAEYDRVRAKFATCRLLCAIGHDVRDPIVDWHDRETGATSGLKLA
jgi:hypothetical protein